MPKSILKQRAESRSDTGMCTDAEPAMADAAASSAATAAALRPFAVATPATMERYGTAAAAGAALASSSIRPLNGVPPPPPSSLTAPLVLQEWLKPPAHPQHPCVCSIANKTWAAQDHAKRFPGGPAPIDTTVAYSTRDGTYEFTWCWRCDGSACAFLGGEPAPPHKWERQRATATA